MNIRAHIVAQILLHVSLSQYQYQYHYTFLSASIVTPLPTPRCLNISLHLGGSCTKSLIVAYIIVDALVDGRCRRRNSRRYFEHHPVKPTRLELEDTPQPRSIVLSSHPNTPEVVEGVGASGGSIGIGELVASNLNTAPIILPKYPKSILSTPPLSHKILDDGQDV